MRKILLDNIKIISIAIFCSLGIGIASAWTAPTQTAPNGNVAAPLNTSSSTQVKAGSLWLSSLALTGGMEIGNGLVIANGNVEIKNGTLKVSGIYSSSSKYQISTGVLGNVNAICRIDTQTGATECKSHVTYQTGTTQSCSGWLFSSCTTVPTYDTRWDNIKAPFSAKQISYNGRYQISIGVLGNVNTICRIDTQTGATECKSHVTYQTGTTQSCSGWLSSSCTTVPTYDTRWDNIKAPF